MSVIHFLVTMMHYALIWSMALNVPASQVLQERSVRQILMTVLVTAVRMEGSVLMVSTSFSVSAVQALGATTVK